VAGEGSKVEGAVLGAAPSALHPLSMEIGNRIARKIFEQRGNHSEAHLSEAELAGICTAAAEVAIIRLEGVVNAT
jgi:hypothetical protein